MDGDTFLLTLRGWDSRPTKNGILFTNFAKGITIDIFYSPVNKKYNVDISDHKTKIKRFTYMHQAMIYAREYMGTH